MSNNCPSFVELQYCVESSGGPRSNENVLQGKENNLNSKSESNEWVY